MKMDNHAHADPRPGAPKTPLESCVAWFREQQRVLAAFAELQAAGMLEAEELLSEALKRVAAAVVHGAVPPHPEKLTPYCLRVIRNAAIDAKKRHEIRRRTELAYAKEDETAARGVRPGDSLATAELRDDCQRAMQMLRQLPPVLAEVVLLRIWQDMNYRDIGEVLGIPVTTAQSRYSAAIARLQTLFHHHHES